MTMMPAQRNRSEWARRALAKLDDLKLDDPEAQRARVSLEDVAAKGYEPYYTLKAYVCLTLRM